MKQISVQKLKYHIAKGLLSIEEQRLALVAANKPESHAKINELEIRKDSFFHLVSIINFLSQN